MSTDDQETNQLSASDSATIINSCANNALSAALLSNAFMLSSPMSTTSTTNSENYNGKMPTFMLPSFATTSNDNGAILPAPIAMHPSLLMGISNALGTPNMQPMALPSFSPFSMVGFPPCFPPGSVFPPDVLSQFSSSSNRRRRHRTTFNDDQLAILEKSFSVHEFPNGAMRNKLAQDTGLTMQCIEIWFKNRRAKSRKIKVAAANDDYLEDEDDDERKDDEKGERKSINTFKSNKKLFAGKHADNKSIDKSGDTWQRSAKKRYAKQNNLLKDDEDDDYGSSNVTPKGTMLVPKRHFLRSLKGKKNRTDFTPGATDDQQEQQGEPEQQDEHDQLQEEHKPEEGVEQQNEEEEQSQQLQVVNAETPNLNELLLTRVDLTRSPIFPVFEVNNERDKTLLDEARRRMLGCLLMGDVTNGNYC